MERGQPISGQRDDQIYAGGEVGEKQGHRTWVPPEPTCRGAKEHVYPRGLAMDTQWEMATGGHRAPQQEGRRGTWAQRQRVPEDWASLPKDPRLEAPAEPKPAAVQQ